MMQNEKILETLRKTAPETVAEVENLIEQNVRLAAHQATVKRDNWWERKIKHNFEGSLIGLVLIIAPLSALSLWGWSRGDAVIWGSIHTGCNWWIWLGALGGYLIGLFQGYKEAIK